MIRPALIRKLFFFLSLSRSKVVSSFVLLHVVLDAGPTNRLRLADGVGGVAVAAGRILETLDIY
jgi:hypothetical protein